MDPERKYHEWYNLVCRILSMTALWPDQERKGIREAMHEIVAIVTAMATFLMLASSLNYCLFHFQNLEQLMRGIGFLGTLVLMSVKIVIIILRRDMIADLIKTLNTMWLEDLKDAVLRPILLRHLKALSTFSYLQTVTVGGAVVGHLIGPITGILYGSFSDATVVYLLPLPVKFLWSESGGTIIYSANYLFSIFVGWACVSIIVGLDGLFCVMVLQITGLLRVVSFRMRNFSSATDFENGFRKCVQRHSVLTRCVDQMQKVYGFTILIQFLVNALVICALIFQASQIEVLTVARTMVYGIYITSKLVQTLMYSWCGELLTHESEQVSHAAYESDWILESVDVKMKRNMAMVIGKRPFVLTACHFASVSFGMFTKIINTAASYYFMLKTVESK
ncbi:odorant receptor 82a-like isoform X1 [Athalia rosae]|uniref:odorant receptor 82a-like isoform X1 n=1 Tax=Athalia rosae TaxID=37344 RepID=UPI00203373E5|nr:odorant receptor 82a-like isoform X1 [Athalia rosae]